MDLSNATDMKMFKEKVLNAIAPIQRPSDPSKVSSAIFFSATRTEAGRKLPDYYLVYFLLVDLLEFTNMGQWEKTAWSVPIEYNKEYFLIEHRKFGIGVFATPGKENEAEQITKLINKGVQLARPYFEFMASHALKNSKLNVKNNSKDLYNRYEYYLSLYRKRLAYAHKIKDKRIVKKIGMGTMTSFPVYNVLIEVKWLALSVIEAFYSWTEHVFIHIAILDSKLCTGEDVARMAGEEWAKKFKVALSIEDPTVKPLYDQLVNIRQQVRNYVAHGSFGKQGEAFSFHSGAGAVPLLLPHQRGKARFGFDQSLGFDDQSALTIIDSFIKLLWSGSRAPAKLYIQDAHLPMILTMASNGQYKSAMKSVEEMRELVDYLIHLIDQSANMDF